MLSLRKPSKDTIDRWLEEQGHRDFNYPEVCATREFPLPGGYNIDRNSIRLGYGEATYDRAVAAVRGLHMWDFHWVQLCWPTTPIAVGSILATLTRQWGCWYLNGCRIVYLIDEGAPARRFGFAYGTVDGHVEYGEERFLVEWREDNSVWYEILAFSCPAYWLMKLGYPLVRRLQKRFAADSLRAMVKAVNSGMIDDKTD